MIRTIIVSISAVFILAACGSTSGGGGGGGGVGGGGGGGGGVDPCDTNTCECEGDEDCADFEVCDTTSTPGRICVCAAAYEDDGSGCAFAGAPADPGFEQEDVWVPSDATRSTIDTGAPGDIDPGVGIVGTDGVCQLDSFTQTFTMPARERSEVFTVDVTYRHSSFAGNPGFAIAINGGWHRFRTRTSFSVESICLGDGGYDGDVEFRVGPDQVPSTCSSANETTLEIDRMAVRKALPDECPTEVGIAINGDFEATGGWSFATIGDGTAGIADTVGTGNSRGLRLTTTTRCSSATATGKISLPTDATMPNSAIEFFTAGGGSSNNIIELQLDGRSISRFLPAGIRRVCIPDWAKGSVQDLSFSLRRIQFSADCSGSFARDVAIDTVSVVSDPTCPENSNDYDNGAETFFNSAIHTPVWSPIDGATNAIFSPATILDSPASANTGNGSLFLQVRNRCTTTRATREIVVPEPDGSNGPALKAFINAPDSPIGSGGLSYGGGNATANEGVGYEEVTLCIDPVYAGRPLSVTAFNAGGGGGCVDPIPTESLFFDDFSITTDSSCPAE